MGRASLQLVFCSQEGQPVFKVLRDGKAGSGPLAGRWLCGLGSSWQPASCVQLTVSPDLGSIVICVSANLWVASQGNPRIFLSGFLCESPTLELSGMDCVFLAAPWLRPA